MLLCRRPFWFDQIGFELETVAVQAEPWGRGRFQSRGRAQLGSLGRRSAARHGLGRFLRRRDWFAGFRSAVRCSAVSAVAAAVTRAAAVAAGGAAVVTAIVA